MDDDLEDYRNRLRIDRDALDEELIQQPFVFSHVADQAAQAISLRDQAYDDRKTVEAEIDLRIRRELEEDGAKFTEPQVKAKVQKHRERKAAIAKSLDAERNAANWMALKEAYMQRSYVLKDLVQLYVAGYFQSGSAKGDVYKVRERDNVEARQAIAAKRRTRIMPT